MLFLLRSSQDYLIFFKHPALNLVDFPLNLLCPFQRPEIYKHSSLELRDACSQPFLRVWQHDCIPAVLISNLSVTSTKKCINCHLGKLCNCLGIRGQHLPICTQSFLTATLISSTFSGGGKTWPATWNTKQLQLFLIIQIHMNSICTGSRIRKLKNPKKNKTYLRAVAWTLDSKAC